MEIKDIINELNALKVVESEGLPYDLPKEIIEKYPGLGVDPVATGLDPDKRRWYTTSVSVYEVADGYIGVRVVDVVKSEEMEVGDIGHELTFFAMKKVMVESFGLDI